MYMFYMHICYYIVVTCIVDLLYRNKSINQLSHYRPTSETTFKWRFAVGPIAVCCHIAYCDLERICFSQDLPESTYSGNKLLLQSLQLPTMRDQQ